MWRYARLHGVHEAGLAILSRAALAANSTCTLPASRNPAFVRSTITYLRANCSTRAAGHHFSKCTSLTLRLGRFPQTMAVSYGHLVSFSSWSIAIVRVLLYQIFINKTVE